MDAVRLRLELRRVEKAALSARRGCELADVAEGPNEERNGLWEVLGSVATMASALSLAVEEIERLRADVAGGPVPRWVFDEVPTPRAAGPLEDCIYEAMAAAGPCARGLRADCMASGSAFCG